MLLESWMSLLEAFHPGDDSTLHVIYTKYMYLVSSTYYFLLYYNKYVDKDKSRLIVLLRSVHQVLEKNI